MKKAVISVLIAVSVSSMSQAADGSWNVDADGDWTNSANWAGGVVPGDNSNDNTDTATFATALTAERTVAVDDPRAIGLVEFGAGVIPAGGGCLRLYQRNVALLTDKKDLQPAFRRTFETIGTAKVADVGEPFTVETPAGIEL